MAAEDTAMADEDWGDLEHEVDWLGPQNAVQPEQSGVGQYSEVHRQKMEKVRPSAGALEHGTRSTAWSTRVAYSVAYTCSSLPVVRLRRSSHLARPGKLRQSEALPLRVRRSGSRRVT